MLGRMPSVLVGSLVALTIWPGGAAAHHGTQVSRVEGPMSPAGLRVTHERTTPALDLTLSLGLSYFGRALSGKDVYRKSSLGSVLVETTTLNSWLRLARGFSLGVDVPLGFVVVRSAGGSRGTVAGPGDVALFIEQDLLRLFGSGPKRLSLFARGGVIAPTGRYDREAVLSVTDVAGPSDGAVGLMTYDTRASLGGDVWALTAEAGLSVRVAPRWLLQVSVASGAPVTRTRDGLRWGADWSVRTTSDVAILSDRLGILGTIGARLHRRDELLVAEPREPAVTRRERTGGRRDAAGQFGLWWRMGALRCSAQTRVPVWQHAEGVQLVESVGFAADCTMQVEL